jgi:hypothetical protein
LPNEPVPQRVQSLARDDRTTSWDDARDRLANPGPVEYSLAWLATVRPDGAPYIVPLWYHWDGNRFWIIARRKSAFVEHLRKRNLAPHIAQIEGRNPQHGDATPCEVSADHFFSLAQRCGRRPRRQHGRWPQLSDPVAQLPGLGGR